MDEIEFQICLIEEYILTLNFVISEVHNGHIHNTTPVTKALARRSEIHKQRTRLPTARWNLTYMTGKLHP